MRAELFSSDFIISFFIFLAAMLIITTYYQNLQTDVYQTSILNDMYSRDINMGSMLATSSGYPEYWNSTSVQVLGLYDSGKFNLTKFEYLINNSSSSTYQNVRSMLGTGPYDFFIRFDSNNSNFVIQKPGTNYNYSYGKKPTNQKQVIVVKRLGIVSLNGSATKVTMEVLLWE